MNKTVLVIDDDVDILDIVCFIVEANGFNVVRGESSEIIAQIDSINPHLILLDNWLGSVSGIEICQQLKQKESQKLIPVIMMSAVTDLEEIARQCNADGFLAKPFDISELESLLKKILSA